MRYFIIFLITINVYAKSSMARLSFIQSVQRDFEGLVSETNEWRNEAISFLAQISSSKSKVFTSEEINKIHQKGTLRYKKLREEFYTIINKVKYISNIHPEDVFFYEDLRSGDFNKSFSFLRSLQVRDGNVFLVIKDMFDKDDRQMNIDLCTDEGRELALLFKLGLASALILYDNYTLIVSHLDSIERKVKLDRIINYDNSEIKNFLKKIEKEYSSLKNYKAMARAVKIYDKINFTFTDKALISTAKESFVDQTIMSSYVYSKRDEINKKTIWELRRKFAWKWFKNKISYGKDKTTNGLSKFFGNTVGLVATRKGKMLDMAPVKFKKLTTKLRSILKPMDVLLEKTPFRLTDKFIPGHWGHVAIWLGTEKELREMGVWNNLSVILKNAIRSGRNVLEALRPGVQVNSLEHFLNIDDLAIIRPNFLNSSSDLEHYLSRSAEQVGKEYDFNFDVETDTKIVCSELAYVVFDKKAFAWPLDKTLGRYTISPDHVAKKASVSGQAASEYSFYPVSLYHDGLEVEKSDIENVFSELLEKSE